MKNLLILSKLKNQHGVAAIIVAIGIFLFLVLAALAIDIGHLYVARNELQNAADAGALAGARFLYNDDGTAINVGSNQIAHDAATANRSEGVAVEVNWAGGNEGDVQRGHWSFGLTNNLARGFYPSNSTEPVALWNVTTEELDANVDFINAIRVVARREATPVASFFARVFGHENFQLTADAVAYIGFAGTLTPHDVDQPIAICMDSILDNGTYSCAIGRFINSGENETNNETGGWTSFNQDDPCTGGTNALEVRNLICASGNPQMINLGQNIATNGGDIQSAFNRLIECWENETGRTDLWNLTLPVINCPSNNVGTCEVALGAVNLNILWITDAGQDPNYNNAPTHMGNWSSNDPDGQARWNSFVNYFNLQNVDGSPAPYRMKCIYFLPDCNPHIPAGNTGGQNFGILAKIPVLVK